MSRLSLRLAGPLLVVFAAAAALLAWMPSLPVGDGPVLMTLGLTLVAAAVALLPLVRELSLRAATADALAERVALQEGALAAAERDRRDLLERLSHDLRTPLASMQGYLELLLLRHGSLDPVEAQNYLQTAARHSERLARLVADLFELARLEAEPTLAQPEPFPVAELAHDVALRYADAASRADVHLAVQAAAAGTPMVLAEVRLVERVLSNLVDNALRHTPCGGHVEIAIDSGPTRARVTVRDDGHGIADADLETVFRRFDTAERTGDTGSSTAGLGLAIARRIAQLHGSTLELQSAPGQGTCVSFTLALVPRPDEQAVRRAR